MRHDFTPTAFQNIDVREPSLTEAGTAVIYTFAGTAGAAGAVLVPVFAGVFAVDAGAAAFGAAVPCPVPAAGGVAVVLYPRAVQILS